MTTSTAIDQLARDFWTVGKVPHGPRSAAFLGQCQSFTVKAEGTAYKYYQRGTGPAVLLMHGVHSNLASMLGLAEELLARGYRVVLFDAPAHGDSPGTMTDPVEISAVIQAVAARFDEFEAIVGHSLGLLWLLAAWRNGVRAKAVVSVSSPATMMFLVDKFAELQGLDDDRVRDLARSIEGRLGDTVWTDLSPAETAKSIGVPCLIIHGAADDFVPPSHADQLHASWPGSTLELVDGVGHFDIVKSPEVGRRVAQFIQDVA